MAGIVYIKEMPRSIQIASLKKYLSEIGPIGRVFFHKKKNENENHTKNIEFSEGWVEFIHKKDAKSAYLLLNGNQVRLGKKNSVSNSIIWNIKYLKDFKWTDLYKSRMIENLLTKKRITDEITGNNIQIEKIIEDRILKSSKQKSQ